MAATLVHDERTTVEEPGINRNKVQPQTIVTQVMARIKELLASGSYQTNDKIPTETELAEMFGVGRSSVREAVKTFQYLGVLEARVPKGTFVRDGAKITQEALSWAILLNQNSLTEVLELRQVLEREGLIRLVGNVKRGTPEAKATLRKLEDTIEEMREAARAFSIDRLVAADYAFHYTIVEHVGNMLFRSIFETLHSFMQQEIEQTYAAIHDKNDIATDHREILDIISFAELERVLERHAAHFARIRMLLSHSARAAEVSNR